MPKLSAELQPAPLLASVLIATLLCAAAAAWVSNHPLALRIALLLAMAGLLLKVWLDEIARGVRRIELAGDGETVLLHYADGRTRSGRYAGYALFGTCAVFVFIERCGWRRLLGAKRVAVLRAATHPDSFRRWRARVRLGP